MTRVEDIFRRDTPETGQAQAAALLMMGARLSGLTDVADDAAGDAFGVPRVTELPRPFRRRDAESVLGRLSTTPQFQGRAATLGVASSAEARTTLWHAVMRGSAAEAQAAAATLIHLGLTVGAPAARVAAATQVPHISGEADPAAMAILREALDGYDEVVAEMAATGLAQLSAGAAPAGAREAQPPGRAAGTGPASMIAHGTWSRLRGTWWRPGGDLFTYLRGGASPELYAKSDYFRWSSAYDKAARIAAAADLKTWLAARRLDGLETVYAHSHGGNVVLEAAANGVRVSLLVLLSVPARRRTAAEWSAIRRNTGRIVSLRVACDVVVLVDRSRQVFPREYVHDLGTVPNLIFDHSALTRSVTWRRNDLAAQVTYERGMVR
ncbi:hypothetical protein KZZ52_15865 [Dactylosporangium sp. AC04546]|uniref:hypothetical protein n=1 Tax=Dactylosporangium sp. AC04546 TaxID=2862460 RepID=UPI001EDE60DB|nr:hypothetical protein [Dactylosporangium sp. AC04546]WVK86779.1 hypothetical protein KZZ52_15865 [Dactylosporangium sp. AC04546]